MRKKERPRKVTELSFLTAEGPAYTHRVTDIQLTLSVRATLFKTKAPLTLTQKNLIVDISKRNDF